MLNNDDIFWDGITLDAGYSLALMPYITDARSERVKRERKNKIIIHIFPPQTSDRMVQNRNWPPTLIWVRLDITKSVTVLPGPIWPR